MNRILPASEKARQVNLSTTGSATYDTTPEATPPTARISIANLLGPQAMTPKASHLNTPTQTEQSVLSPSSLTHTLEEGTSNAEQGHTVHRGAIDPPSRPTASNRRPVPRPVVPDGTSASSVPSPNKQPFSDIRNTRNAEEGSSTRNTRIAPAGSSTRNTTRSAEAGPSTRTTIRTPTRSHSKTSTVKKAIAKKPTSKTVASEKQLTDQILREKKDRLVNEAIWGAIQSLFPSSPDSERDLKDGARRAPGVWQQWDRIYGGVDDDVYGDRREYEDDDGRGYEVEEEEQQQHDDDVYEVVLNDSEPEQGVAQTLSSKCMTLLLACTTSLQDTIYIASPRHRRTFQAPTDMSGVVALQDQAQSLRPVCC